MSRSRASRARPRGRNSAEAKTSLRRASPRADLWSIEAVVLIGEITAASERIAAACDADGQPIVATDATSRMLRVLERAWGQLSIADIGRQLRISRQAARKLVIAAAERELVELDTHPHDRRLIRVELSRRGRSEVAAAQAREKHWVITLLNGLDVDRMRATSRILRVLRQRLARDERSRLSR